MNISKTLKYLRQKKGWTQADLHRATGYERAYISKLESGKVAQIGLRTAMTLCRAFEISVEEFWVICQDHDGRLGHKEKAYDSDNKQEG